LRRSATILQRSKLADQAAALLGYGFGIDGRAQIERAHRLNRFLAIGVSDVQQRHDIEAARLVLSVLNRVFVAADLLGKLPIRKPFRGFQGQDYAFDCSAIGVASDGLPNSDLGNVSSPGRVPC
jgi:hypothetical protein